MGETINNGWGFGDREPSDRRACKGFVQWGDRSPAIRAHPTSASASVLLRGEAQRVGTEAQTVARRPEAARSDRAGGDPAKNLRALTYLGFGGSRGGGFGGFGDIKGWARASVGRFRHAASG